MRPVNYRVELAGGLYGLHAVVLERNDPPLVVLSGFAIKLTLYPVEHVALVVDLDDFLNMYAVEYGITDDEAYEQLMDDVFIAALEEMEEDNNEAIDMCETGF